MAKPLVLTWIVRWVCVLSMVVVVSGCDNIKTVDDDIKLINTTAKLQERLANSSRKVMLIDVRKESDFNAGHIPGAINIPVADLYRGDLRLSEARDIVVYSQGWVYQRPDRLSWAAATKLLTLGYKNVYDYRGGLTLWEADGQTVTTVKP
ncbi:MAG: rhodanese-like domain-containing protein [Planctomycetota bacterium]